MKAPHVLAAYCMSDWRFWGFYILATFCFWSVCLSSSDTVKWYRKIWCLFFYSPNFFFFLIKSKEWTLQLSKTTSTAMCLTKEHNYYNYSVSLISSSVFQCNWCCSWHIRHEYPLPPFVWEWGPDLHSVCFFGWWRLHSISPLERKGGRERVGEGKRK